MAITIIDSFPQIQALCSVPHFDRDLWNAYIDSLSPTLRLRLEACVERTLAAGLSWEEQYLPALQTAWTASERREALHRLFLTAVDGLENRIPAAFARCPQVDILFYFGLCTSAGWATTLNGRPAILLGLEKILELNWDTPQAVFGLVYHELGHLYQERFGTPGRPCRTPRETFLWQLFTEGIAMYFEQVLMDDPTFYQQDVAGWRLWCDAHFSQIKADFEADLDVMTFTSQRWFGDWVRYEGRGDVGYYLGCRFVRFALRQLSFDELIRADLPLVSELWRSFIKQP